MSESAWTLELGAEGITWLVLDVPGRGANTLSSTVLEQLEPLLASLEQSPPRVLGIKSGKANGFIAGADVHEFTTIGSEEQALRMVRRGQSLCDRIAALPCPTIALLHGFALGGGLELALACRYRVGIDDGRLALGLPEVQLGIHPGFGGTVRSVRLLGVRAAMGMMLTGRTIRGEKALHMGLVDRYVPAAQASRACAELARALPSPRRPSLAQRALSWRLLRGFVRPSLEEQLAARVKPDQHPAPYAIVDLWARHGAQGREAYEAEAHSIARLFQTPTAHNLVRVFQLQERLKGLGGQPGGDGLQVRSVHVVGAGIMGGDIAAWCALRGMNVTLQDRSAEQVAPAIKRAAELFARRLPTPEARAEAGARLTMDVEGNGVATADLVIEAIFEDAAAKRALYASLEPRMRADALLATNTSSLVLQELATELADPGRFVGLHFFNPVAQMPLVEVIEGPATRPAVLASALAFVRRLDKLPLPCRSAPGFLVNRVLIPYMQEGLVALEEGTLPEIIDAAATRFGMPMGPIELADVVGLDICKHVGEIIGAAVGRTPPLPLKRLDALVEARQLGRKSGQGFYQWVDGKARKQKVDDAQVSEELTDRLMLTFLNESVTCLRNQVVADADLVDAGVIFGAGFAPFRGGPLRWAQEAGPDSLFKRLEVLAMQHGSRFEPDAGWSLLKAT